MNLLTGIQKLKQNELDAKRETRVSNNNRISNGNISNLNHSKYNRCPKCPTSRFFAMYSDRVKLVTV